MEVVINPPSGDHLAPPFKVLNQTSCNDDYGGIFLQSIELQSAVFYLVDVIASHRVLTPESLLPVDPGVQ